MRQPFTRIFQLTDLVIPREAPHAPGRRVGVGSGAGTPARPLLEPALIERPKEGPCMLVILVKLRINSLGAVFGGAKGQT